MAASGDLTIQAAMPSPGTAVTPIDGTLSVETQQALEANDAASIAAFEKAKMTATAVVKDEEGKKVQVQVQSDGKQPEKAAPSESRPDGIEEADWKGTLKDTIQALKNKAHLDSKREEKAKADTKETPAPAAEVNFFEAGKLNELNAELAANQGKLSDETRKSLKATHKLSDEVIDATIANTKLALRAKTIIMAQEVGGEEELKRLSEWYGKKPDSYKQKIVVNLNDNDEDSLRTTAKVLQGAYESENGREGRFLAGNRGGGTGGGEFFRNSAEKQEAINARDYARHDEIGDEYRASVDAKILESRRRGIIV